MLNNDKLDLNYKNIVVTCDSQKPEEEYYDSYFNNDIRDHFYDPCDNRNEYKDPEITTVISYKKRPFYFAIEIIRLLSNKNIYFNAMNEINIETNEYYEKFANFSYI